MAPVVLLLEKKVGNKDGTYPWSSATLIFHNGKRSHEGACKAFYVITSTSPLGTLGSVASLSAVTHIKEILIGITSFGMPYQRRDTLYAGTAGMLLHLNGNVIMRTSTSSPLS